MSNVKPPMPSSSTGTWHGRFDITDHTFYDVQDQKGGGSNAELGDSVSQELLFTPVSKSTMASVS